MSKSKGAGLDFAVVERFEAREEEGRTIEVVGPDGKPLPPWKGKPVTITVYGEFSRTYQETEDEFNRTWLAGELADVPDDQRAAVLEKLWAKRGAEHDKQVRARCIKDWYGVVNAGEPMEVTPENCQRIMEVPWLRSQIRRGQSKHEDFFEVASGD